MSFHTISDPHEKQIVSLLVKGFLAAGCKLGVNDGEVTTVRLSTNEEEIFDALATTDEDLLLVWLPDSTSKNEYDWIRLIYGNGWDVISDNTLALSEHPVVLEAEALANKLCEG